MSEANRAEDALTNPEQELRLRVQTIPALAWRAGPEGNVEYVNKRVLEYFGAPLGEIVRRLHIRGEPPRAGDGGVLSWYGGFAAPRIEPQGESA